MSASSRADSFPGTRSSAARKVISPSTLPQPPGTLHGSGRNDRLRSVGSYEYATASTSRPVTAACRRQKAMASTGSTVIAVPAPVVVPPAVPDAGRASVRYDAAVRFYRDRFAGALPARRGGPAAFGREDDPAG